MVASYGRGEDPQEGGRMSAKDIDAIVIHCSATREGQDDRVADIDKWHKGGL